MNHILKTISLILMITTLFISSSLYMNTNAQEYDNYYNNDSEYTEEISEKDNYYSYYPDEKNPYNYPPPKMPPTQNPVSDITINKELYACNKAEQNPTNFTCSGPTSIIPIGPNSGQYIPCSENFCFVDESDFKVQVFKDVALAQLSSPTSNTVNLANDNYIVTEGSLEDRIRHDTSCDVAGFDHFQLFALERQGEVLFYEICVNYKGDCSGTISDGEIKECTVQNYLVGAFNLESDLGNISDEFTTEVISELRTSDTNNMNTLDFDVSTFNTNTSTSPSNTNTGDLPPSFSPPILAQETEDLSTLEKMTKLKQQWMKLIP
jgi:hypothetical protein